MIFNNTKKTKTASNTAVEMGLNIRKPSSLNLEKRTLVSKLYKKLIVPIIANKNLSLTSGRIAKTIANDTQKPTQA